MNKNRQHGRLLLNLHQNMFMGAMEEMVPLDPNNDHGSVEELNGKGPVAVHGIDMRHEFQEVGPSCDGLYPCAECFDDSEIPLCSDLRCGPWLDLSTVFMSGGHVCVLWPPIHMC
eukprot:1155879-Pelagomonas_calceolata.AAC.7